MNVTRNKIETFNKWKDFYEKSFDKIFRTQQNQERLYEFKFNKLKKETKEDFEKDMDNAEKKGEPYYEDSILYLKLEGIKDVIPLVNKNETSLINNFHTIFEEQYNTLYNIYWTKDDIEFYFNENVNKIKYNRYLDYISNLIYLKLYKDLNMIYILLNTFMETNKITKSIRSLPAGVDVTPNEKINIKNIPPLSSNTGLNSNKGIVNNNRQGVSIPKKNTAQLNLEIQNCSKKIQKSINNTIKEISNNVNQNPNIKVKVNPKLTINELNTAVNNCSKKLEKNIKDFIEGLNSNVKGGGTNPSNNTFNSKFLVEVKNLKMDTKQYNDKLKEIKKAYEDGLKDNIKGFKKLCKILKEYIENKNKIVTDFIDKIRIRKKNIKKMEDILKKRAKYLIIEKKKEKKNKNLKKLIEKKEKLDEKIKKYESIQKENKKIINDLSKSINADRVNSGNDISGSNIKVKEEAIEIEEKIIKGLNSRIKQNEIELNKNKAKIKKYELDIEKNHQEIMIYIEKALDIDFKKTNTIKKLDELKNLYLNLNTKSIDRSKQNQIKKFDNILEELIINNLELINKEEKLEEELNNTNNIINQLNIDIEQSLIKIDESVKKILKYKSELYLLNNISNRKDLIMNEVRDLEKRNEDIFYKSIKILDLNRERKELHGKIDNLMVEIDKLEGKMNNLMVEIDELEGKLK
jgi:hypothetical protein